MAKKKDASDPWTHVEELREEVRILKEQLRQLEQTRSEQVDELLGKQAEMMSDIAELLTRCVK